jgi:hypothetical protein
MIEWFRRVFAQDDFADDWYGWLTNQISHIGLGLVFAVFSCWLWMMIAGEFPVKWVAWPICVAVYLALEAVRGWSGWDSAEDTAFTTVYGTGGAFLLFTEVSPGDPFMMVDFTNLPWVLAVPTVHLALGAYFRA